MPGRIDVGVGPDRTARRIMLGISLIIKIVFPHVRPGVNHSIGIDVGVNQVITVPAIEVEGRDQGI